MFKKENKCEHRLLALDWANIDADYYKCVLCGEKVNYLKVVKS